MWRQMDYELTEEQRSLRESIVEFATRELNEDVVDLYDRVAVGATVVVEP